jgi:ferrochelatase
MSQAPIGLLGLNLGGPRTLDDVRPFLERLFADRDIIRFPGGRWGQRLLARLVVRARLPSVLRNYASIGGGSPIYQHTAAQLEGVAQRLTRRCGHRFRPYIAFRYTRPSSEDALRAMYADGVEEVVVLTLYPQYSTATTGSSLRDLGRALDRTGLRAAFRFRIVDRWYDHPGYLAALAGRVRESLAAWPPDQRPNVFCLFSAHSLPLSIVQGGDSYPEHVAATVRGVLAQLGPDAPARWSLAYQSQTGPVRWLGPRTEHVLRQLGAQGERHVLVVPVSFVSDHIETLYEVDQLFAGAARQSGITTFRRTRSLNDEPAFLDALADLVENVLGEPAGAARAACASP